MHTYYPYLTNNPVPGPFHLTAQSSPILLTYLTYLVPTCPHTSCLTLLRTYPSRSYAPATWTSSGLVSQRLLLPRFRRRTTTSSHRLLKPLQLSSRPFPFSSQAAALPPSSIKDHHFKDRGRRPKPLLSRLAITTLRACHGMRVALVALPRSRPTTAPHFHSRRQPRTRARSHYTVPLGSRRPCAAQQSRQTKRYISFRHLGSGLDELV
ncbi:hypothetical protein K456DRAFT_1004278 [Colletotrichum gloeosporioides 23]|nr:hypothetical protein K456DRAFT_1004278 [Colletotrichum gloeosporioides 23]